MTASTLLRPAHRFLSVTAVTVVAATVVVSVHGATPVVDRADEPSVTIEQWSSASPTREWRISATSATTRTPVGRTRVETAPLLKAPSVRSLPLQRRAAGVTGPKLGLASAAPSPAMSAGTYESQVISRVNAVRTARNLRPVTAASCPVRMAGRWSSRMASTGDFRHQSMTRLLRTCDARYVGETLGRGQISPRTLVSMWMRSTPHRQILLSTSPRRIGVGATPNSRGEWLVTADFMRF